MKLPVELSSTSGSIVAFHASHFRDQLIVEILPPLLQVRALHRILDDVEEKRVVENLEELEVAVADGPLRVGLVAPVQRARDRSGAVPSDAAAG